MKTSGTSKLIIILFIIIFVMMFIISVIITKSNNSIKSIREVKARERSLEHKVDSLQAEMDKRIIKYDQISDAIEENETKRDEKLAKIPIRNNTVLRDEILRTAREATVRNGSVHK